MVLDDLYPGLYPPGSSPQGKTYAEWLKEYTRLMLETPVHSSPFYDDTGKLCDKMKIDNVYLLAGTYKGLAAREFNIGEGFDLLILLLEKNVSKAEDKDVQHDETALMRRLVEGIYYVTKKYLIIDDKKYEHLDDFLVQTPLFNIKFPEDPVYPVNPGPTQAAALGFPVMIKKLDAGPHTIQWGFKVNVPITSPIYPQLTSYLEAQNFTNTDLYEDLKTSHIYGMDVKYRINVGKS